MQCTTLRAKSVPIAAYGQFHSPHLMLQCNYFGHIPHLFLHRAAAGNVKISSFFRLSLLCPATWQRGANWRRLHQLTSWYDSDHLGSNMPRWDGRVSISQDFPSIFLVWSSPKPIVTPFEPKLAISQPFLHISQTSFDLALHDISFSHLSYTSTAGLSHTSPTCSIWRSRTSVGCTTNRC
jgi:hypothetical protein